MFKINEWYWITVNVLLKSFQHLIFKVLRASHRPLNNALNCSVTIKICIYQCQGFRHCHHPGPRHQEFLSKTNHYLSIFNKLDFDFFTIIVIVKINGVINAVRIRVTGLGINNWFFLEEKNCLWPTWDLAMSSIRMMTAERMRMKESESLMMMISDVRSQGSRVWLSPVNTLQRITASLWPRLTDSCVIIGAQIIRGSEFLDIAF